MLNQPIFCVAPVEGPELIYAQKRYERVRATLDESAVGSELSGTGAVMETSLNIIAEYLLGRPEVTCIIDLGGVPMTVTPLAMKEAGREDLPNGGFGAGPEILEAIKTGITTATMNQPELFRTRCERVGEHGLTC